MSSHKFKDGIERFIDILRLEVMQKSPELIKTFETYAAEAVFGRRLIEEELINLSLNQKILEVGAGSLILSCQLQREGFNVTALEPFGDGFNHFRQLQNIVISIATELGCLPQLIGKCAEDLNEKNRYDFAFSINVMEHVNDVERVINNVVFALKGGASYRFICPNYIFPYEPHFNIPTLFTKVLTERVFRNAIFNNTTLNDPLGTWNSLNWITLSSVKRVCESIQNVNYKFRVDLFSIMIGRVVNDPIFSARRSKWLTHILSLVVFFRLHYLTKLIPSTFQPVIDCNIKRVGV